jgi:hypothetical protein
MGGVNHSMCSPKTKWNTIKDGIAKFVGVHSQVLAMKDSKVLLEGLLDYTLQAIALLTTTKRHALLGQNIRGIINLATYKGSPNINDEVEDTPSIG